MSYRCSVLSSSPFAALLTLSSLALLASVGCSTTASADDRATEPPITEADVEAVQEEWGEGIVEIGRVFSEEEDYRAQAEQHIRTLYAYDVPGVPVLFKPTLASDDQFREDFEGALSYFVGGNSEYPEDNGFAIAPYTAVRWESTGISVFGDEAMAMGNYFFTTTDGNEVKVEYSFGYVRDADGKLRIVLHHSSLPYTPTSASQQPITEAEVLEAQQTWGEGIVAIGRVFTEQGDYVERASEHIRTLYAYPLGVDVLFKPTLAAEDQFRGDFESALSYFVGGNEQYAEDNGFAIAPYTAVRWESEGIELSGATAMAMGNYFFTTTDGNEVKVEYSFGYVRDNDGNLRIVLHHSSLPYAG